jgi:hypothetical protein
MKTLKELKKGDRILLAYGDQNGDLATCNDYLTWVKLDFTNSSFHPWEANFIENEDSVRVFAEVVGFETEMGSVYAHDVIAVKNKEGNWERIEHTKEQVELREQIKQMKY